MGARNSLRRFQTSFMSWANVNLGLPAVLEEPLRAVNAAKTPEAPPSSEGRWRTPHTIIEEVNAHDKIRHRIHALAALEGRRPPRVVAHFNNLFPASEYPPEDNVNSQLTRCYIHANMEPVRIYTRKAAGVVQKE
jgi:hypothetical protein